LNGGATARGSTPATPTGPSSITWGIGDVVAAYFVGVFASVVAVGFGIDAETAMATTAMPLRTEYPLTTDPFKYRLMELVGVYGDALRERSNELWGDGILSAIDCKVTMEKKGERGVITIDAKFLHYKEF